MAGVPNVFGSATAPIPLSQLDTNFNTQLTIGSTIVGLGNTVTSLSGLANVAMTGNLTYGGVTLSNAVTGTGNMVLSASPTLTGTTVAAKINTNSGSTGGLSLNTWVSLYTIPASGVYLAFGQCQVGASGYSFGSIVSVDSASGTNCVNGFGGGMESQMSGNILQARQVLSGGTLTCTWAVLRVS